uniref:Glycosyl-hydrolase family 116 catalytic region domain-containing protein n=1 Tax=Aegilops tauschii subsp. strangulata TaxID=200361 RepID=A0A453FQC3_AEGTS
MVPGCAVQRALLSQRRRHNLDRWAATKEDQLRFVEVRVDGDGVLLSRRVPSRRSCSGRYPACNGDGGGAAGSIVGVRHGPARRQRGERGAVPVPGGDGVPPVEHLRRPLLRLLRAALPLPGARAEPPARLRQGRPPPRPAPHAHPRRRHRPAQGPRRRAARRRPARPLVPAQRLHDPRPGALEGPQPQVRPPGVPRRRRHRGRRVRGRRLARGVPGHGVHAPVRPRRGRHGGENGRPDQTYDFWAVSGVSAYTGGLWVAALQAAAAMARVVGDRGSEGYFLERHGRARRVYDAELWNGAYFDYDNSGGANSRSIMADQLAGQWYARACGLEPIVEEDKARSALGTVLDYNVMRVQGGAVGAVNGMRPDGAVDASSIQSREVWPGVTYAVAAAMVHEGMPEAAFRTAKGAHDAGWGRDGFGYAFQMPEAWTADGGSGYRSLHYMRPLCIWAMQWALSPPELHGDVRVLPGSVSAVASPAEVVLAREKFEKVASMLRLPEEEQHKGYLRALYQILRQMLLPAAS